MSFNSFFLFNVEEVGFESKGFIATKILGKNFKNIFTLPSIVACVGDIGSFTFFINMLSLKCADCWSDYNFFVISFCVVGRYQSDSC